MAACDAGEPPARSSAPSPTAASGTVAPPGAGARNLAMGIGEGRDPEGDWPAEPSVLAVGISRHEAEVIGRSYEQNAIVFIERGKAPELVAL